MRTFALEGFESDNLQTIGQAQVMAEPAATASSKPQSLYDMLLGPPITARTSPTPAQDAVGEQLERLCSILKHHHRPDNRLMQRVCSEVAAANATDPGGLLGATCRRALLLLAIHMEPSFSDASISTTNSKESGWQTSDAHLDDMQRRVLPLLVPRYLQGMCQEPDVFVNMAVVLLLMWRGDLFAGDAECADTRDETAMEQAEVGHTSNDESERMTVLQMANAEEPPPEGSTLMYT